VRLVRAQSTEDTRGETPTAPRHTGFRTVIIDWEVLGLSLSSRGRRNPANFECTAVPRCTLGGRVTLSLNTTAIGILLAAVQAV
jgi:hypothetical protein